MAITDSAPTQGIVVASLLSAATLLGWYLYNRRRKEPVILPETWTPVGYVSKLYLYPLKSGNRIEITKVECTPRGFTQIQENEKLLPLTDRGLLVYKDDVKEFRTARTYPQLFKIDVSAHDEKHIAIDAPTMRTLYVKIPDETEPKTHVKLWQKEEIPVADCGDEAARWFSSYIFGKDSGLRLGFYHGNADRNIKKSHKKLTDYYKHLTNNSFGRLNDLTSLLLINQASVDDLKQRIEGQDNHITALNFRPNIIVDGPNLKPYAEDHWDFMKLGDEIISRNVKECTRCIMTTIDPDTAERNKNREPLRTLEKYRMSNGPEKSPIMGINLEVLQAGKLKTGDPVFIGYSGK